VVLETNEEIGDEEEENAAGNSLERMRLELHHYRRDRRDLHTHRPGSYLWSMFPYEFDLYVHVPTVAIWYLYYARLEDFYI